MQTLSRTARSKKIKIGHQHKGGVLYLKYERTLTKPFRVWAHDYKCSKPYDFFYSETIQGVCDWLLIHATDEQFTQEAREFYVQAKMDSGL